MLSSDATLDAVPAAPDAAAAACLHCGQPVGQGDAGAFCCFGCRAVHDALRAAGLTRFYELRGGPGEPVGERGLPGERRWLEPLSAAIVAQPDLPVRLQAHGVRCAACVWVFEQVFADLPDAGRVELNPTTGALELQVGPHFPLADYVDRLERFGYRLAPAGRESSPASPDTLLLRLGVCSALALNAMVFAAAIYLGLPRGPLFDLLHSLGFGAAMLSVVIGGPVFFGSALTAVRNGVAHLDVPIAVGIGLTTGAAVWSFVGGHHGVAYYDSLAAFVALMLAGRYLQERAVERNRAELRRDVGFDRLTCQRERGTGLESASYAELEAGDVLLLAPGELLPVSGELLERAASCGLDWIDGEPEPRDFRPGQRVPAGAFNLGLEAMRVRLDDAFSASELLPLIEPPATGSRALVARLQRFSALYVVAVLVLAAGGLAGWLIAGDVAQALSVATAVCVVTCPCAIGVAVPLTYQLLHARLRRHGVFVRDGALLDRLRQVRAIVFDKTGTLTTGRLQIVEPTELDALDPSQLEALYALCARSLHPRSVAIRHLLEERALAHRPEVQVHEHPGRGLEATVDGHRYRLGRADFAWGAPRDEDMVFGCDGQALVSIALSEVVRADAAREIADLQHRGYRVEILSGDAPERVASMAQRLGVRPELARGGLSPEDKAAAIDAGDPARTLMVGDGINDALAMSTAAAAGTPAVDRAFVPARTDFHFTAAGLAPVGALLQAARDAAAIVRANLAFAVAYNLAAVAAALAGLMQPWVAAIVMPLSSILVVARTSAAVVHRSRSWKF